MEPRFGPYFKKCRIARRKTLRAFCNENDLDPGNISRLERGLVPPPDSDALLAKYARALGLKRGSATWFEFFDQAAAERGRIPRDILTDEEILAKLPVLFRTLRGAKLDGAKLDELIERLRRA